MRKNCIYTFIILACCIMFTGCDKDDERALVVNKSWLTGAKWYDFWSVGNDSYEQMFIFNYEGTLNEGTGYEVYTKNGYTVVDEFDWYWRGYTLVIELIGPYNFGIYEWDVLMLDHDILTIIWDHEETTFFPI